MIVQDLIIKLASCPLDMEVVYYWDGSARSRVEQVRIRHDEVILLDELACYDRGENDKVI